MQKISCTVCLLFIYAISYSQVYKSIIPSPAFTNALDKIVLDFRLDYHTIQNDSTMVDEGDHESYRSKVTLPGSTDCSILRFHSTEDTTAAFQAIFYQGDNYDEAAKSYRNCIRLLKKARMNWIDRSLMMFNGEEKEPDPGISFTVTTLHLDIEDERYKYFCADVELTTDMLNWKVDVSLSSKRPDTEGATN